ncbi:restriction endonuclease subunit S [Rosenbergiella epipactidis]|uniref:restriction endonuclease subunit S n=1 Tax=Rosenbergiella epipactidis TaxID=1544694 RepID=UPI001F4F5F4A|nr:restriction endonuclease subunit S [Rosenbergiella epipactidis]
MNSWTLEPFGNLADFKNGLNFRAGETGHELKVLGVGDFKERTKLEQVADISSIHTEKKIDKSYLLQDGDLVFVRSNGNPALVGRCMQIFTNNEDISFSGFTIRARLKTDKTTPELISLFMQGGLLKNILKRDGRGTNISNLNQDILSKLQIPIPSKAEQMELLSVFGCWDNAIEKTEALIAAKEKQFEWLCTNLLSGRKKSLGFTGKSIPTAFGSIFSLFKKVNTSCADYEVLSVTKDGIVSQSEYFNKEVASKDKSKYLIVDKDTLVMSGLNFWMGAIDFQTIRDTAIVSPAYKTFKVNEGPYSRDYLRFFIRSHYMTKILLDSSIQGASIVRRNLDMEWLSNSLIDLPNLEEQIDIANILSLAEKEIDGLKLLAEKYHSQKRGLMQKLLSGEWQVGSSQPLSEETYQEASA